MPDAGPQITTGAGWMNSTTDAGTWITAGAGEMYSTATFCGNCRGVWGPPAPCPLPLGPLGLCRRGQQPPHPTWRGSVLTRPTVRELPLGTNGLPSAPAPTQRADSPGPTSGPPSPGGGQEASWVMIVVATLDANWRSSLIITPKEVDTFSSNCETLWIEKTVWYAKPLELWPGPESSFEGVLHKARDPMRSDVPPVTPSGEARDDCHGMRWWRHHLKTSLVLPTQSILHHAFDDPSDHGSASRRCQTSPCGCRRRTS